MTDVGDEGYRGEEGMERFIRPEESRTQSPASADLAADHGRRVLGGHRDAPALRGWQYANGKIRAYKAEQNRK